MKKFLLVAAAAIAGFSAVNAADVYFNAEGTTWNPVYAYSWEPNLLQECEQVTVDGHDLWKITLNNAMVIFRSSTTSWGDALQTSDLKVVNNAVYGNQSLKSNGGNDAPVANIVDGKYVEVNTPVDEYPAMYLVGAPTNWSTNSSYKMATTDGVTYSLKTSLASGAEFKFYGGSWGVRELTLDSTVQVDTQYTLASGDKNIKAGAAMNNVTIFIVCDATYSSATLYISTTGELPQITPPVQEEFPTLYIRGDVNSWGVEEAYAMTREDNIYTITLPNGLSGAWKIGNASWTYDFGAGENGIEINAESDAWFKSSLNFNTEIEKPVTITLTVVEGSAVAESGIAAKLLVETETVNYPDLYVLGDFNEFEGDEQWKMTRNDNVYTYTFPTGINTNPDVDGAFVIATPDMTWYFGPKVQDQKFVLNEANQVYLNYLDHPWGLVKTEAKEALVTLVVDPAAINDSNVPCALTIQTQTAVANSLAADNEEAVYFNLQGVRVANPENGLFIKVQGNKTAKVAL